MNSPRTQSYAFILLTFVFSSVPYGVMLSAGTMTVDGGWWVLAVMWCPGLAGLVLQVYERRSLRGLGWTWGSSRLQASAYLLPLAYAGVAYIVVWITGLGRFPDTSRIAPGLQSLGGDPGMNPAAAASLWFAWVATVGFAQSLISATGEEIGWRGYLIPRLSSVVGPTKATWITGTVWALWHFPAIFLLDYHGDTPSWFSAVVFLIMVLGISFAFTWLRLASGSLWSGAILHASHNAFIQGYFDPLTGNTGLTPWFTGEFGFGLAVTGAITGYLVWRKTMRAKHAPTMAGESKP